MLDVQITVSGDRVAIANFEALSERFPGAIKRALKRIAPGIHREAYGFLSGAGRTPMRLSNRGAIIGADNSITKQKSRLRGQSNSIGARPGSYPVPVVTGNLRRMLDWLDPGQSKSGLAGTFTAGDMEIVVFNSAAYANAIHEGRGSSSGFGPRPFLFDGLKKFNEGARIKRIVEEELNREIDMRR